MSAIGVTKLVCYLLALGLHSATAQEPPCSAAIKVAVDQHEADLNSYIQYAAKRFGLSASIVHAVMRAESGGNARAISPKGAVGLMQVMPATWAELRNRHRLGVDPFDPRDNILAGAAYLREMLDRFGEDGFLAAYNAGPARYQRYVDTGRPLPRETVEYVAAVRQFLGEVTAGLHGTCKGSALSKQLSSPLFVPTSDAGNCVRERLGNVHSAAATRSASNSDRSSLLVSTADLTGLSTQTFAGPRAKSSMFPVRTEGAGQ